MSEYEGKLYTKRELLQAVKEAEKKLIDQVNKVLKLGKRRFTIGYVYPDGGAIEELFICDKDGDEVPNTAVQLKESKGL